jgi:hypothetical protein
LAPGAIPNPRKKRAREELGGAKGRRGRMERKGEKVLTLGRGAGGEKQKEGRSMAGRTGLDGEGKEGLKKILTKKKGKIVLSRKERRPVRGTRKRSQLRIRRMARSRCRNVFLD